MASKEFDSEQESFASRRSKAGTVCRNYLPDYGSDSCKWGDDCKYLHETTYGSKMDIRGQRDPVTFQFESLITTHQQAAEAPSLPSGPSDIADMDEFPTLDLAARVPAKKKEFKNGASIQKPAGGQENAGGAVNQKPVPKFGPNPSTGSGAPFAPARTAVLLPEGGLGLGSRSKPDPFSVPVLGPNANSTPTTTPAVAVPKGLLQKRSLLGSEGLSVKGSATLAADTAPVPAVQGSSSTAMLSTAHRTSRGAVRDGSRAGVILTAAAKTKPAAGDDGIAAAGAVLRPGAASTGDNAGARDAPAAQLGSLHAPPLGQNSAQAPVVTGGAGGGKRIVAAATAAEGVTPEIGDKAPKEAEQHEGKPCQELVAGTKPTSGEAAITSVAEAAPHFAHARAPPMHEGSLRQGLLLRDVQFGTVPILGKTLSEPAAGAGGGGGAGGNAEVGGSRAAFAAAGVTAETGGKAPEEVGLVRACGTPGVVVGSTTGPVSSSAPPDSAPHSDPLVPAKTTTAAKHPSRRPAGLGLGVEDLQSSRAFQIATVGSIVGGMMAFALQQAQAASHSLPSTPVKASAGMEGGGSDERVTADDLGQSASTGCQTSPKVRPAADTPSSIPGGEDANASIQLTPVVAETAGGEDGFGEAKDQAVSTDDNNPAGASEEDMDLTSQLRLVAPAPRSQGPATSVMGYIERKGRESRAIASSIAAFVGGEPAVGWVDRQAEWLAAKYRAASATLGLDDN